MKPLFALLTAFMLSSLFAQANNTPVTEEGISQTTQITEQNVSKEENKSTETLQEVESTPAP